MHPFMIAIHEIGLFIYIFAGQKEEKRKKNSACGAFIWRWAPGNTAGVICAWHGTELEIKSRLYFFARMLLKTQEQSQRTKQHQKCLSEKTLVGIKKKLVITL